MYRDMRQVYGTAVFRDRGIARISALLLRRRRIDRGAAEMRIITAERLSLMSTPSRPSNAVVARRRY